MPNVRVAGDAEGFGLVALEASAIGKPVAAADLEGLRDAVTPGENGWRFAAGNAQAWIDGLSIALRDRAALAALGSRARVYAQRFDWNTIGESYAAIASRIAPA
jgi:phosphatidylinositol alpha-1,6-mannosyltransferase